MALLPGRQEQRVFEHQGHPSALVRRRIFGREHRVLVDILAIIEHLNDVPVEQMETVAVALVIFRPYPSKRKPPRLPT